MDKYLNSDLYDIDSIADMTTLMFDLETQVDESFLDELDCLVSWIIIATQTVKLNKLQKQKDFLRFLKDKDEFFQALDIRIQIPPYGSSDQVYEKVKQQVEALDS